MFWRGTTTGAFQLNVSKVIRLPRYNLCLKARRFADKADVRFYSVVQSANYQEQTAIIEHLGNQHLLGGWTPIEQFTNYKYILQIGGNATSWGLVQKLRLGCCILLVEGEWRNWHEQELIPWIHYVPVSSSLADLDERIEWCFSFQSQAKEIAIAGRQFATQMSYADELKLAANKIVDPIWENSLVLCIDKCSSFKRA